MKSKPEQYLFTISIYIAHALYVVLGVGLMLLNAVMVGGILRDKALRRMKEYVPLGALALCDAINGYRLLAMGSYRLSLYGWRPERLATSLDCLLLPQNFFIIFAVYPLQPVMFTVLSLDRLIAIAFPVKYVSLGMKYGLALSGGACLFVILLCSALALTTVIQQLHSPVYEHPWFCGTPVVYPKSPRVFMLYWMFGWTMVSTICTLILLVTYWWKNKKNPVVSQEEQVKRQIRITKTVGLSALLTFILYALPYIFIASVFRTSPPFDDPLSFTVASLYSSILGMSNSLIQPVLVVSRLKELRRSVKKLPLLRRFFSTPVVAIAPAAVSNNRRRERRVTVGEPAA